MRRSILTAALAVLGALSPVRGGEEPVALDKVPKAVLDAVKKRFPNGELTEAAKETNEDKKTVYEVTVKDEKRKIDVTLTPEGVITIIEKEMDAKDFPKAVTEGLMAKYPNATIKFAEQVIAVKDGKETLDYYEALLETADKKSIEVEIAIDGKIKKTEEKTVEKNEK